MRHATDAKLMRKAGIRFVRMGEFDWSRLEPKKDQYSFEWLDDVIGLLPEHGIRTILGTPVRSSNVSCGISPGTRRW